jgi:hypothetical protein
MTMPLVLLNRRRRSGGFNPATLFALSEPGVWYDPSDLTTMFTDTAGTTQAAVGQAVALVLDKSKGLVLGPELVTNGTFDSAAGWSTGTGWTISGGVASFSNPTGTSLARTDLPSIPTGRLVKIEFDVTFTSGAGVTAGLNIGGGIDSFGTFNTSGRKTAYVTTTASRTGLSLTGIGNSVFSIDNISVKELPGFHATQSTTTARPILARIPEGGRRNLLTRTEELLNTAWRTVNATVTDQGGGAFLVTETSSSGGHYLGQTPANATVSVAIGQSYTFSVEAKLNTGTRNARFSSENAGIIDLVAVFNLVDGTVVSGSGASIENLGDGWYRLIVTRTGASTGSVAVNPCQMANGTSASYTGDGTSSILYRKPQFEQSATATDYQKVVSTYDVTEAGKADLYHLVFDGTDDWLVTPTITPGVDKAQVFAGVRKLSDAAQGVLAETSTDANLNSGALAAFAPFGAAGSYGFRTRGTTTTTANNTGFTSPITNVVTGIGDISGDTATLRVNGTQAAQSTADQGTGNYLAYPLYIGRRAGTFFPFNGHLYSLIVRFGANLDAGTISSTEGWVAGKTGVVLP